MRSRKIPDMEKGCILPFNLHEQVIKEDNVVLLTLSRFCDCTSRKIIDALKTRNEIDTWWRGHTENYTTHGYRQYPKTVGKKVRMISQPCGELRVVQDQIKKRLDLVPISFASTAMKWNSAEKNAQLHRLNPYLITMDIKNAYPSIDTHRVYKNLQWSLWKILHIWCPLLKTDEEKDLFIRTITHLCVNNNQLPQWASTSTQIQNIVMSTLDSEIEKKIPELVWSHMIYSRYADDITVSFPHFSTLDVLKEKFKGYLDFRKKLRKEDLDNNEDNQKIISYLDTMISKGSFIITDRFELKYLQEQIERLKMNLNRYEKRDIDSEEFYKLIGIINGYKENISFSGWRIWDIKEELLKVIWWEWWKVNNIKTKIWTPQSNSDREINGISFDKDGKQWVSKKKRSEYMRIFEDIARLSIDDIENHVYYRSRFKLDRICSKWTSTVSTEEKLANILKGIFNRLVHIYGNGYVPSYLHEAYNKAKEKLKNNTGNSKEKSEEEHIEEHVEEEEQTEEENESKNDWWKKENIEDHFVEDEPPFDGDDLPF